MRMLVGDTTTGTGDMRVVIGGMTTGIGDMKMVIGGMKNAVSPENSIKQTVCIWLFMICSFHCKGVGGHIRFADVAR